MLQEQVDMHVVWIYEAIVLNQGSGFTKVLQTSDLFHVIKHIHDYCHALILSLFSLEPSREPHNMQRKSTYHSYDVSHIGTTGA